ncbi:hypothetical protein SAMN05216327_11874 [Dyadobacter sp. SG02]|nr:hypothetical protein SAMN05216327_11874 [Dyadobacter sp. SG02]
MTHYTCPRFSIGLDFYEIMALSQADLSQVLARSSREEIIDWLQWNDPNGVYSDEQSRKEFGEVLSKAAGAEIILRVIKDV